MNTPTNGPRSVKGSAVTRDALNTPTVVLCCASLNTTEATITAWKNPSAVWPTARIANSRRKSCARSAPRARSSVTSAGVAAICRRPSGLRGVEEAGPVGVRGRVVALDEGLHHLARHVVAELHRWRLHEVGGRTDQRAAPSTVLGELGAPERVDDHPGGVRRVPHLELHLDRQRDVPEVAPLEPDQRPLAILEPRYVVGRTDVDVVLAQRLLEL